MARPLEGITVVAMEQAVAAPLCTARLADAGARVIKIERPEGDFARGYDRAVHGQSSYFVWLNRGKESIALDIKQPGDADLLHAMIARADVFIQNLAPGGAARAGFGSADLRARHPRLITVDITGYGDSGPPAAMKAYDFLIQCEAGLAAITGSPDAPARVGVSVADIACGLNAHAAVLEALIARGQSGTGSGIAVSLFDGIAEWMAVPLLHHEYGGKAPERCGLAHPSIAPYGAFACADGQLVVIAVQNEREWSRFCSEVLGQPDLANDPRFCRNAARTAHRDALDALIAAHFSAVSLDAARKQLGAADIAFAAVNPVSAFAQHPALRRITADSPAGPVALPAPPVRWSQPRDTEQTVPAIDQHGPALRAEFG